jgi:hypothetical protein
LGVAIFGAMFTSRLSESLTNVFTGSGASPEAAANATATLEPAAMSQLPQQVQDGIVTAYAESLAPVFWYLVPFLVIALVLAITMKQIPLSDVAGMVARGEAIGGEEAVRLEAEREAPQAPGRKDLQVSEEPDDDAGTLVNGGDLAKAGSSPDRGGSSR